MNFIPGLELNKGFFFDIIKPLLDSDFPNLTYSASLIGYGSDVLGFDNETSMDHNWGPRCQIFLDTNNIEIRNEFKNYFSVKLPQTYRGFPTNYTDPQYDHTQTMQYTENKPIRHLIEIITLPDYLQYYLKTSKLGNYTNDEWLSFNDQCLLELTSGEVFYDGLNILNSLRTELKWYPIDIAKLKMAALWKCIWNEEAFIGRCIELNDRIGIKLIQSRIINYLLKLLYYFDRKYIPYSKWFGFSVKNLSSAKTIIPIIESGLYSNDMNLIQNNICQLYKEVINIHNSIDFFPKLDNIVTSFFNRPYKVIYSDKIVDKLVKSLNDEKLKKINLSKIALDLKIDSDDLS